MNRNWIISVSIVAAASAAACGDDAKKQVTEVAAPYCETAHCPDGTTCDEALRMCVSVSKPAETNPCDKCTDEQECIENRCVDKKTDPCDLCTDKQECIDNTCVDIVTTLCDETDEPTCNGNAVVSCEDGQLVPHECDEQVCEDGECVDSEDPDACELENFEVYCDGDSVVTCVEGFLQSDECPEGQYCNDGTCTDTDFCTDNPNKLAPGECGCAIPDLDLDENGTADCHAIEDLCPDDPEKTNPGRCGCGVAEGSCDSGDLCPDDEAKTTPGVCGCDAEDTDSDGDGIPDCIDACPNSAFKFKEDACACDLVHVSLDETDYCAIPIVTAQDFVGIINGIADASQEVTADTVYALMRNINLADVLTEDAAWKPVTFPGKLTSGGSTPQTIAYTDAAGERLALHCADTDESCGLFGKLSGARIHNINLNLNVTGIKTLGGLAGLSDAGTKITDIQAATDITGAGSDIGGVIGFGSQVVISGITHQGKVINIGANTQDALITNTGGIAGKLAGDGVIGFAGPRVIEQTVREKLPPGFQRSEFLIEKGAIDMIVRRPEMRLKLASILAKLMNLPAPNPEAPREGVVVPPVPDQEPEA